MSEKLKNRNGRPWWSPATIVATVCVIAGVFLSATVDMGFLGLFAAGVFGPGILRELGWLRDHDELQRQSARVGGYRAYLAAGVVGTAIVAVQRSGTCSLDGPIASVMLVVLLGVVVWALSALFDFWGASRAVSRILLIFGSFWLAFNVLGHITDPLMMLMQSLVALPFFLLAFTARRWPRATGMALVVVAALAFVQFDLYDAFSEKPGQGFVLVLLFLPLIGGGVALLTGEHD